MEVGRIFSEVITVFVLGFAFVPAKVYIQAGIHVTTCDKVVLKILVLF